MQLLSFTSLFLDGALWLLYNIEEYKWCFVQCVAQHETTKILQGLQPFRS